MPSFTFTSPEGKKYTVNGPEGATKEQAFEMLQKQLGTPKAETPKQEIMPQERSEFAIGLGNLGAGALSGAGQIGSTILAAQELTPQGVIHSLINKQPINPLERDKLRRAQIEAGLKTAGADTESGLYQTGKIGAEIAGTAGAGGLIGRGLAPFAPQLANAVSSGGFNLAQPATTALNNLALRAAGGAIAGGAMSGMVNPRDALMGAGLGAVLPVAVKGAGQIGQAITPKASPEVAQLANKAKALGIDVPADRLIDNKPLNAMAASLNYVPFSGRAGTEEKMSAQIHKAVSRTIGQDSSNITDALKKAGPALGSKFDDVLKNNVVNLDDDFINALTQHEQTALSELETGQAKIIQNQINEILNKSKDGVIDGQAAYNIKRTLDRIGKQNSPVAYYAKDLKMSLMDALDRSLGPEAAKDFAATRQQYSNMINLEKLAPAGAEGEISMGKLANLRNVKDPNLRDIIDIAAQFGRTREAPHGAAQRVTLGALAGPMAYATGQVPLALGAMAGGRLANTALNSQMIKNAMLQNPAQANRLLEYAYSPYARAGLINAANQ